MRRTRIGCAVFALWVVTSTAWADDPAVKGTAALEGTWSFLSWEIEGEKAPASTIKNFRWIFRGNQAVWSSGFIPEQKLTREEKYTIETDPNKSPKWITLTSLDTKGKDLVRGIYALEDGKLKMCLPSDPKKGDGTRPKEFRAGRNSGFMLMVLERAKDK